MTDKITNWTSADDAMVESAIRRGASRRELLKMLLAGCLLYTSDAADE